MQRNIQWWANIAFQCQNRSMTVVNKKGYKLAEQNQIINENTFN